MVVNREMLHHSRGAATMSRRFGTPPDCVVRRHVDEVEAARRVVVVVMVDVSFAARILIVNTNVTVSL